MRILLSNDDGIHALGLREMHDELRKLGDVWVVAPLEEKSTTGHSLTIHKPLRLIPMTSQYGSRFYAVSGSPADCVYLGIRQVIGRMPDLVVSGINRGGNLGQDVYYSGTVSAAREACMLGIPAMAVSLAIDFKKALPEERLHYATAAKVAVQVLRNMKNLALPDHTMLNLNVPDVSLERVKGLKLARQGFRFYSGSILRRTDHRGKDYFWVGGHYKGFRRDEGSDCEAIASGFASLTPLKLDSTDLQALAALSARARLDGAKPLFAPVRKKGKGKEKVRKLSLILTAFVLISGCAVKPVKSERAGLVDRLNQGSTGRKFYRVDQGEAVVRRTERVSSDELRKIAFEWPLKSVQITSQYGKRGDGFHEGIDLRAKVGTPVYAAQAGTVLHSGGQISGYGKMIVVRHAHGWATIYAHNSKLLVKRGQYVKKGQKIALAGKTGRASGPHLHFEVRNGLAAFDPAELMSKPSSKKPARRTASKSLKEDDLKPRKGPAARLVQADQPRRRRH